MHDGYLTAALCLAAFAVDTIRAARVSAPDAILKLHAAWRAYRGNRDVVFELLRPRRMESRTC
jgi:hypothetical protein